MPCDPYEWFWRVGVAHQTCLGGGELKHVTIDAAETPRDLSFSLFAGEWAD